MRGAGANDKNREALGRSQGGLTSKIHLLAEPACRPLTRVTSAGQRHNSLALLPLVARLKITRRGRGRPRTRPGRLLGDKAYSGTAMRFHLGSCGIKATCPRTGGPGPQPPPPRQRGRSATGLRSRRL